MANNEELARNEYYFTKILKGKSKTFRAKCFTIPTWNPDSELQLINSVLSSICSISEDKSNRFQTLDKFECKTINDGEYICITLSNQFYPKTLKDYLDEFEDGMPENECLSFVYQIARCLEDLGPQSLIKYHGNLKLSNVFLDNENNVVAIGDFYIKHVTSKVHDDEALYKSMINHLPPEFFTFSHDRDEYSDVWAIGVMLYQLSTGGEFPFNVETDDEEFDEFETKRGILNIQYDKLEDRDNSQLLLEEIFTLKPHNRITASEILKFLQSRIDMKRINTAMKRASENLYNSDEEEGNEIKKKLDFLIAGDASDDEIINNKTSIPGLDYKKTDRNFGDNIRVSESRDEEDFKHLDNLVRGHVSVDRANPKAFMDNLPDSYGDSSRMDDSNYDSQAEDSRNIESIESAGQLAKSKSKQRIISCIKTNEDQKISTNMLSLVKIVMLNKDKLLLFSDAQNYFMSLKSQKLQTQELFAPLSPSDAVLYFAPWPGVFSNSMLIVYKNGKILLVDLQQSAERQKLHMITKRVNFSHLESQSIADSVTERSDAGERKFLVPLSGCEFAIVYEQAAKFYQITDFDLKWVKEYEEIIEDSITNFCYYHTNGGKSLTHLAIGTESSSQVVIYNIKEQVNDKTLEFDEDSVTNVFEIGVKYIAATSINGHLAVWDKNTHIQILKDRVMEAIFIVTKIPDSTLYAIGGEGPLLIYDGLDRAAEVKLKGVSGGIIDIVYNQDLKTILCGDGEGTLYTYNIEKLLGN